jgi:hypothetical protein
VQLSGKKYVFNLEGLKFEPMLQLFVYKLSAPDGLLCPHGGRWGWSGPRRKFEFKIKFEFELMQDLE